MTTIVVEILQKLGVRNTEDNQVSYELLDKVIHEYNLEMLYFPKSKGKFYAFQGVEIFHVLSIQREDSDGYWILHVASALHCKLNLAPKIFGVSSRKIIF